MPFYLKKREDSASWWVRGSYKGNTFFKCTQIPHGGLDKEPAAAKKLRDQWQKEFEKKIDSGGRGTFGEAIDIYLEAGGSPRNVAKLKDRLGSVQVSDISQRMIDKEAKLMYPDCTPQSLNRMFYTPFIAVWNHCSTGQNPLLPVVKWSRPKGWKKIVNVKAPVTHKAAVEFINACPDHSAPVMFFMFWTGCRPIEAIKLKKKNVNLKAKWAVLEGAKDQPPRGIPLHHSLIPMLKHLTETGDHEEVFLNSEGNPYKVNAKMNISGRILDQGSSLPKKTLGKAPCLGLGITPYTARHTVSNYLTRERLHDERDQILGHEKTISSVYVHLSQKDLIQAIETLPDAKKLGCKLCVNMYNGCTNNKGGK